MAIVRRSFVISTSPEVLVPQAWANSSQLSFSSSVTRMLTILVFLALLDIEDDFDPQ